MRKWVRAALAMAVVLALVTVASWPYVNALAFIARAAEMEGVVGRVAAWRAGPIVTEPVRRVPTRHGEIEARIYRPAEGRARRTVTLVPGVHMDGIHEIRLVALAEDLAASGFAVMTFSTPDLQRFSVAASSTDMIEDAAGWLADREAGRSAEGLTALGAATDGRIGMLGISFSGGLSIVAAGRPPLRDRVAFVMSFGGHGDLLRVMRYLCSAGAPPVPDLGEARARVAGLENVTVRPPHDYGVAVVLRRFADRGVVPPDQVDPLRAGILTFLHASSLTLVDMAEAEAEFARARAYAETLPEPSRTLMGYVNDRAVDKLGPILLPVLDRLDDAPVIAALSPEQAPPPAAPVFLLHGTEDTVIPPVETLLLTNYLHPQTDVRAVLSGLITHAEVDRGAAAIETWRLASFWRDLMSR